MRVQPWSSRLPAPHWLGLLLLLEVPFLGRRPLFRDEVQTQEAARKTPGALWGALHHLDAPVGAYYAMVHVWTQVSGSDTWLRLPSLLAVAGAVALTVLTAERLGGRRAGLVTGLLLLANPATWVFGGYARPYGLALCVAAGTLLLVLTAPRRAGLLLVLGTLTLYLQGMFVLLLLGELFWLLRAKERRAALALVVAMALWLPLALFSTTQSVMTSWIPHTAPGPLLDYVRELFGTSGALSALALLVWAAAAVLARRRRDLLPLLLLGTVPVVVLAAAGLVAHVLGGRYALYAVLVVALALGLAATTLGIRSLRPLLAALLVLALGNVANAARSTHVQEDLPAAAAWLVDHDRTGDGLLYSPDWARAAFLPSLEGVDAEVARQDLSADTGTDRSRLGSFYLAERSADEIRAALGSHPRLWVVGYDADDWRPTPNTGGDVVTGQLADWTVVCRQSFGQITVRLLSAPTAAPTECAA